MRPHDGACKSMHKQIITTWGSGWTLLGAELRRAIIAERVLMSVIGLDEGTSLTPAKIADRYAAMLVFCGIE